MKINKQSLGILYLVSLLCFNILNILNINLFYIRSIYSFFFLLFVPGILLWKFFKIKDIDFWNKFSLILALSLSFLLLYGLFSNWVLLLFHIAKPLRMLPLLIMFDIFFIFFAFYYYFRQINFSKTLNIPNCNILNISFFVIPIFFPLLSFVGASILNNSGTNLVSMILISSIAIYILLVTFLFQKFNENVFPWSLFFISSALLLMLSLRSNHVIGTDILIEYKMFTITNINGFWSNAINHAYNTCLSITLLPTIFYQFMNVNGEYLFKFYFQLIFGFVPVIVYIFSKRFINTIYSYIGTISYISFPIFIDSMTSHVRQEIAFFFFSILILTLFTYKNKKVFLLSVIFSASLVVSHYSTTYITILLFLITFVLTFIFRNIGKIINYKSISLKTLKLNLGETKTPSKRLTISFLAILILLTYIWNNQINNNTSDLQYFLKALNNLKTFSINNLEVSQSNPLNQFNIFKTNNNQQFILSDYLNLQLKNKKYGKNNYYNNASQYQITPILPYTLPLYVPKSIYVAINITIELIEKIIKIFLLVGVLLLFIKEYKNNIELREYYILTISGLILLLIFMIIPYISVDYDILRTFQQLQTFLIYPTVLGALFFFKFFNKKLQIMLFSIIVITYLLIYTHFIFQLTGGQNLYTQLDANANELDSDYLHDSEITSTKWLSKYRKVSTITYIDDTAQNKILLNSPLNIYLNENNFPSTITKYSYVYLDYINDKYHIFEKEINGVYFNYRYSFSFLNNNMNKVYNNGETAIYK